MPSVTQEEKGKGKSDLKSPVLEETGKAVNGQNCLPSGSF